ncbi:hypothetical protein MRX96_050409 [Rhipicephalus microplus]
MMEKLQGVPKSTHRVAASNMAALDVVKLGDTSAKICFLAPRGNWEQAIRTWWEEHRSTSRDIVGRFNFSPRNGHFTQMAWSRSAKVGCGATDCPQLNGRYMVCNYEPGGNMLRQPVYTEGWPCSQCPQGTQCASVQGSREMSLCARQSLSCPPRSLAPPNRTP